MSWRGLAALFVFVFGCAVGGLAWLAARDRDMATSFAPGYVQPATPTPAGGVALPEPSPNRLSAPPPEPAFDVVRVEPTGETVFAGESDAVASLAGDADSDSDEISAGETVADLDRPIVRLRSRQRSLPVRNSGDTAVAQTRSLSLTTVAPAALSAPEPEAATALALAAESADLAPRPVPTDDANRQALVEELRASRGKGLLKPDIPAVMAAFEATPVTVTLLRGNPAASLLSQPNPPATNMAAIPVVRDYVNVELDGGEAFEITPKGPDRPQDLRRRDVGQWAFLVTPTSEGVHEIKIRVLFYDAIGFEPVDDFTIPVRVNVPLMTRVARLLEGWPLELILLTVAGAASALLYDKIRHMRRRKILAPNAGEPFEETKNRDASG